MKAPIARAGGGAGNQPFHQTSFVIFLIFLPLFFLMIVLLLAVMQYKQLKAVVSKDPVAITYIPESKAAQDSAEAAVRAFFAADGADSAAVPVPDSTHSGDTLPISSLQLSHLAMGMPALVKLGWKYHLDLEDTVLVARTTVPAEEMRGPGGILIRLLRMKGFLNSEIRAYPLLESGKVTLIPVSARMNGEAAPTTVLTRQGDLNPREWVEDKSAYDASLAKLKSVRIAGGRLLLIKKP